MAPLAHPFDYTQGSNGAGAAQTARPPTDALQGGIDMNDPTARPGGRKVRHKDGRLGEVLAEHGRLVWVLLPEDIVATYQAADWEDVPPLPVWAFGDLVTHPEYGKGVVGRVHSVNRLVLVSWKTGTIATQWVPADSLTAAPSTRTRPATIPEGMRLAGFVKAVRPDNGNKWQYLYDGEQQCAQDASRGRIDSAVPVYVADPDAPPLAPVPEGSVIVDVETALSEFHRIGGYMAGSSLDSTIRAALKEAAQ